MDTIDELFTAFKGPAKLGTAIGKSTEHANAMRRRGSIPVRYWPSLLAAAAGAGITLTDSDLVKMHTARAGGTGAFEQGAVP